MILLAPVGVNLTLRKFLGERAFSKQSRNSFALVPNLAGLVLAFGLARRRS